MKTPPIASMMVFKIQTGTASSLHVTDVFCLTIQTQEISNVVNALVFL